MIRAVTPLLLVLFRHAGGVSTKLVLGLAIGAFVGLSVPLLSISLGLAQKWQTVPAWIFVGALLGSVHPTVEAILRLVVRLAERLDAERPGEPRQ